MNKFLLFCVTVVLLTFPINSVAGDFKQGSEPDGFRGMKWGEKLNELTILDFIYKPEIGAKPLDKVYVKKNDSLIIGAAQLESIQYWFWNEMLEGVSIDVDGQGNILNLEKALFYKFGIVNNESYKFGHYEYNWKGNVTTINYQYDLYGALANSGLLTMSSTKVHLQRMEYYGIKKPIKRPKEVRGF